MGCDNQKFINWVIGTKKKKIQLDRDKCLFFWEKKKTPISLIRQQENNLSIKLVKRLKLKKKKKTI